jgi:tetratricopeptide (TPR) repeat protein
VRDSRLREALLSALADWQSVTQDEGERQRVGEVYQLVVPPDALRPRLMAAVRGRDSATLVRLMQEPAFRDLPPATLVNLARELRAVKEWTAAERLLRSGLERYPGDFWLNHDLGMVLKNQTPPRPEEAVRYLTAALALRYDSPGVYNSLGRALTATHDWEAAIRCYRTALQIDPKYAAAHSNLGAALWDKGQLEEAMAECREAIRLKQDYPEAHNNLGAALHAKRDVDGAIAAFREAIRLKQDYPLAHHNLGGALRRKGQLDEAIAEYRKAIVLNPRFAEAHIDLGDALQQQGEFPKALVALRRGHELGSRNPRWRYPSAQWVRQCERLVELDRRLPDFLADKAIPASTGERVELAQLCAVKHRNRAALRFYEEAFAAEPALLADHRYTAACAAALAGCGRGQDADKLAEKERASLRRQALDWLRADLDALGHLLETGPEPARHAARVAASLQHWLTDADFAGVRGPEALARLPEAEQQTWRQLWGDVRNSLTRAQDRAAPGKAPAAK